MTIASGFFDIRDDSAFFGVIENVLDEFRSTKAKKPEHLLLIVLGLAHLREWIAPSYKRGSSPSNAAERFAAKLFENNDYQTLLLLTNHAKHQRRGRLPEMQSVVAVEMWDDRDTPIDSWLDTDKGPAASYHYGERDLAETFSAVAAFYKTEWFSISLAKRLSE